MSVIATLAVFGVGYLARPIGGIFFGRMGDRLGRRPTLLVTIGMMGFSTFGLGLLPTYAVIGIFAPLLLLVLRLCQGFAAGGEVIGAATYANESSTPGRRGLYSAATPAGAVLGIALAPILIGTCTALVGVEQMAVWGWRLPFLAALFLTIGVLFFRLRIEDSPEYLTLVREKKLAAAPLREAFKSHKLSIVLVIVLATSTFYMGYAFNIYMPVYFTTVVGLSKTVVPWLVSIVMLISVPFVILGGLAVDRFGRKAVLTALLMANAVVVYPLMSVLGNSRSSVFAVGLAYLVLLILTNSATPAAYEAFSDLFPARVRYTAAAIGFNIGNVIGGGFGPYASAQLVGSTGDTRAPAYLVAAASVLGILAILVAPRRRLVH
ncbi:MFS superfamily proline/betaine transporter [Streptomyces malaysiensis]|uniref:MFS superfamily proline/betaine transporter n=1 Tax=Streptomyces malaysiensis TaxID=92644 RepID=A0A7X6B0E4_STRMQ|nr:MFS superfamily proline/betaine transporter [Streptomyces malaysiensis]